MMIVVVVDILRTPDLATGVLKRGGPVQLDAPFTFAFAFSVLFPRLACTSFFFFPRRRRPRLLILQRPHTLRTSLPRRIRRSDSRPGTNVRIRGMIPEPPRRPLTIAGHSRPRSKQPRRNALKHIWNSDLPIPATVRYQDGHIPTPRFRRPRERVLRNSHTSPQQRIAIKGPIQFLLTFPISSDNREQHGRRRTWLSSERLVPICDACWSCSGERSVVVLDFVEKHRGGSEGRRRRLGRDTAAGECGEEGGFVAR